MNGEACEVASYAVDCRPHGTDKLALWPADRLSTADRSVMHEGTVQMEKGSEIMNPHMMVANDELHPQVISSAISAQAGTVTRGLTNITASVMAGTDDSTSAVPHPLDRRVTPWQEN